MKIKIALFCLSLFGPPSYAASFGNSVEAGKIYINGQWLAAQNTALSPNAGQSNAIMSGIGVGLGADLRKSALNFLNGNAGLLHLNAATSWGTPAIQKGNEIETHRIGKIWRGLPVVGGEALVHFAQGKVLFANADATELDHLSNLPRLSSIEARNLAFASYSGSAVATDLPKLEVLILENASSVREARLVYEVTVHDRDAFGSDVHFIDANRGDEVKVRSNVHTLAPRIVLGGAGNETDFDFDASRWRPIYAEQGACNQPVTSWWNSANTVFAGEGSPVACENVDSRKLASAKAAWNNAGQVYEYYRSAHNRNSIDDRGMQIVSIANFGGEKFANAAWYADKKVMLYGYGDGVNYYDFAAPLDVAGHEITHGITSATAALEYSDEPGALNESYSDVFGKLIAFKNGKPSDWTIGRELYRDGVSFVRDMDRPEIGHYRDYQFRGELCNRLNDFCGVHSNSGIPSKAAVLLARKIGLDKLGKIYYLTLTQLLRSNSNFHDAKAQTEAACSSLYGASSPDCRAVRTAFESVGI